MSKLFVLLFVVLMWSFPPFAYGQEDHKHPHEDELWDIEIKIGKSGEINLPREMAVSGVELKKGRYVVRHAVKETEHWFTFTKPGVKLVEVRARALPVRNKVKSSQIVATAHEGDYDIVKIVFAGELVEYVFPTVR